MRNRLAEETSPYLRQHADNPVHWHAWNDEALATARDSGKPILLSVGYSACHWCHVMAHESFEDAETARVMNDLYVNIKVDREERPDLDKIYQTSHQLFTGQAGGWPLTVFLTPDDHLPIFTGTYFPKERRYGMPAFREVLTAVDDYYRKQGGEIRTRGASLVEALEGMAVGGADDFAALTRAPFELARQRLEQSFDEQYGGFGQAPKFPHAPMLDLLLAHWQRSRGATEDEHALAMLERTLDRMAEGGLYDQLAGGFFRYSVDRFWSIPHFEKMLYDNAQLLAVYADAYAATRAPLYARVARETAEWTLRDMQDARGGFYSTLDADSEHEEGKFYVFTPAEVDEILGAEDGRLAKRVLGLDRPANFEGSHWHLYRAEAPAAAAAAFGLDAAHADERFEAARDRLRAARERRVWPGRDEKLIVSWNGLMIGGLARAARVLGRPDLAEAATRAVDFIRAELWSGGRLKATYKDGRARFAAYLDDYANLARGGFFFTADDHERLIHRPKPFADEAVPAGNGVAAVTLVALGHLLGEQRYLDAAERIVRAAWSGVERHPEAHATLLGALDALLTPPELVVVRGTPAELERWGPKLDAKHRPQRLAFAIPNDAALPGLLGERAPRATAVAYICEGMTCRAPLELVEGVEI